VTLHHYSYAAVELPKFFVEKMMDPEDAHLIIDLCPSCARKVVTRNHVNGMGEEPKTFRIVAPTCDQSAPVATPAAIPACALCCICFSLYCSCRADCFLAEPQARRSGYSAIP
jgi:hypothetical protein